MHILCDRIVSSKEPAFILLQDGLHITPKWEKGQANSREKNVKTSGMPVVALRDSPLSFQGGAFHGGRAADFSRSLSDVSLWSAEKGQKLSGFCRQNLAAEKLSNRTAFARAG